MPAAIVATAASNTTTQPRMASGLAGWTAAVALPFVGGTVGALQTTSELRGWHASLRKVRLCPLPAPGRGREAGLTWPLRERRAQPWFNPPNWVFGPAWSVLYVCMGTASWLVARHGGGVRAQALPLGVYAAQLALNFAWTPLFFGQHRCVPREGGARAGGRGLVRLTVGRAHRMRAALVDMALMWVGIAACVPLFYRVSPAAGLLMAPYLGWVSFASVLNYSLIRLNPEEARKRF
jgi:translocator protein